MMESTTELEDINNNDIDNILLNLKIISQIKENEKITLVNNTIEIDNRFFQSVYRWFAGDNRTITLNKIKEVIENSYNIIDCIILNESANNNQHKNICNNNILSKNNSQLLNDFSLNLSNTIKGLENLKTTYKYDITINSELEIIIDNIKDRIAKIHNILKIKT